VACRLFGAHGPIHSLEDAIRLSTQEGRSTSSTREAFRALAQRVLRFAVAQDPASEEDVRRMILSMRGGSGSRPDTPTRANLRVV
jgi:hypothetical protein